MSIIQRFKLWFLLTCCKPEEPVKQRFGFRYRHKHATVEAIQFDGSVEGCNAICMSSDSRCTPDFEGDLETGLEWSRTIKVKTGKPWTLYANAGEYIVKLPDGEMQVMTPASFEREYEPDDFGTHADYMVCHPF